MIIGVTVRRHHDDQQVRNWLFVRCAKRNGMAGAHEQRERALDSSDAGVRDGHALAQSGGANLLAPRQRAQDRCGIECVRPSDVCRCHFQRAGAIGNIDVENDLLGMQPLRCPPGWYRRLPPFALPANGTHVGLWLSRSDAIANRCRAVFGTSRYVPATEVVRP
ncbi:MAG: hypothetical protein ABI624_07840 [Casimicrobiaceae bacterium]